MLTPSTIRLDLKCGKGAISKGEKCTKGPATQRALSAGAVALSGGLAAVGAGVYIMRASRGRGIRGGPSRPAPAQPLRSTPKPPVPPRSGPPVTTQVIPVRVNFIPPDPPRLRGNSPRALLPPSPKRLSKTQRMRANTGAAVRAAEQRIAQTGREELRRIAQIGNTMAAAGEASGMAAKTTFRELRIRAEAARRKYEPGYRKKKKTPPQLPSSNSPIFQVPVSSPTPLTPVTVQQLSTEDSIKSRSDACWKGYTQIGMKRKGKKKVPNCVPATKQLKDQIDTEDGKKYSKTVTNPETGRKNKVSYGAKGYKIAPGTDKGDRYCARSFGDMKSHNKNCAGPDRNTPLCLSRSKWKCSGKASRRDSELTPGKFSAR